MSNAPFSQIRRRRARRTATLVLALSALAACGDSYDVAPTTPPVVLPPSAAFSGSGDLTAKLAEFRAALGDPDNRSTPGQQAAGRREVNWDGAPAVRTNTNDFPSDFFNTNVTRGVIYTTPGAGFRVSDNDFADVNALYDAEFEEASPVKTFMSVGSNIIDVTFRVAGGTQVAAVKGFGVIFSDVDRAGSAKLEMFDATEKLIGTAQAPIRSDAKGLSLVGLVFQSPLVARVRITAGQGALGATANDSGTLDLVVMDDFLYSEPTGI